jgi:hypothetical protein
MNLGKYNRSRVENQTAERESVVSRESVVYETNDSHSPVAVRYSLEYVITEVLLPPSLWCVFG